MNKPVKNFLNGFDYFLMPFVLALAFAALFKGVWSQIDFFSDLLLKETISNNSCYRVISDWCVFLGNEEKFDYSYRFRVPILSFLFPFPDKKDVVVGVLMFEMFLVAYVCFRFEKYREGKYRNV